MSENQVENILIIGSGPAGDTDSLGSFDLVVTTPQYGLPEASNVLIAALPFGTTAPDPQRTALWAEKLSELPRPFTALRPPGSAAVGTSRLCTGIRR